MSYYPDDDGVKQRQPDDEGREEREEKKKTKGGVTAKQHFHREQQVKQHPREQVQIVQVVDPRPRYVPPAIGVPEDNPGPIFLGPGNHAPMLQVSKGSSHRRGAKIGNGERFGGDRDVWDFLISVSNSRLVSLLSRVRRVDWCK